MNISSYHDMQHALDSLMVAEREHLIVKHNLRAGEVVEIDTHKSREWIIVEPGIGEIQIWAGDKTKKITFPQDLTYAILIPRKIPHRLAALTDVSYTVLRDGFD
jgi:hypothetical protein